MMGTNHPPFAHPGETPSGTTSLEELVGQRYEERHRWRAQHALRAARLEQAAAARAARTHAALERSIEALDRRHRALVRVAIVAAVLVVLSVFTIAAAGATVVDDPGGDEAPMVAPVTRVHAPAAARLDEALVASIERLKSSSRPAARAPAPARHSEGPGGQIGEEPPVAPTSPAPAAPPLEYLEVARLALGAGFVGEAAVVAVAVAAAESRLVAGAHNPNRATGDDSYGLWQINMLGSLGPDRRARFGLPSNEALFDAATNARVAFGLSGGGASWGPWTQWRNGAYRAHLGTARAAVDVARIELAAAA